ncbi:hypothetical protein CDO52_03635 [Nocardiopsis gilva YIM 90087]|uniref:DUF1648 domain-containing protein n=1 Tax=Nocardiopsis gilva YIM 90087 TaxID=1235441 RepID=A0A223S1I1_9ACTN|nr:hypothetical protein CDO52_03635 [Nocardiopsis gilva YIM 90087]
MSVVAMLGIAWAAWDLLPEVVTTREATVDRTATEVSRWVVVGAVPAAAVLCTVLMVGARPFDRFIVRFLGRLGLPAGDGDRDRVRDLNAVLITLALFFFVTHCVIIAYEAGAEFPVVPVALALVGAVVATLGVLLRDRLVRDTVVLARAIRRSGR